MVAAFLSEKKGRVMSKVSQAQYSMWATSRDYIPRFEMDRQVRQFQRMKMVGNLMCGLAHDFKNILTIILSGTELAKLSARCDARRHLKGVTKAATQAQHLVEQVLLFGRQQEQEPRSVHLAEVIQKTMALVCVSLPPTIKTNLDQVVDSHCCVLADPIQISQIVMNLCLNAAQSMRSTGGVLELSLKKVTMDRDALKDYPGQTPGSFVRLRAQDTGSGIPPEVIGQIFDPFFTTKQSGEGMGMGLTVVRDIVNRHDGMMFVDSTVGKGTRFEIYLPIIADQRELNPEVSRSIKAGKACPIIGQECSMNDDIHAHTQHLDSFAFAHAKN